MTRVVFLNRKPRPAGNFSIETIFRLVAAHLPADIVPIWHEAPCYSNGVRQRLRNVLDARRHQADINHVTGDTHYLALGLSGRRTVLTVCDCVFLNHPNRIYREFLRKFWLEYPARRAARVTVISLATRDDVLENSRCPRDKIEVIYPCISDRFVPSLRPFNRECPQILQLGTAPNKNVNRVVAALDGLSCRLVLVGRMRPEIDEALRAARVPWTHVESVSEDEILRLYSESDIVSLPSLSEGFGMPIVEANAVGRAALSSNCSSMPEAAGDAAHLVDPRDVQALRAGFQRLIEDETYRQDLIERGLKNRERFRPSVITGQYVELYRGLLEGR